MHANNGSECRDSDVSLRAGWIVQAYIDVRNQIRAK